MKWNYDGEYLNQFDPNYRGAVGDKFCRAVRAGCDDPEAVLEWIATNLRGHENPVWQKVRQTCKNVDVEAWDFAQHILDRESLSPEDKEDLKRTAIKVDPVWMKDGPTEKQLVYLKGLGCQTIPTTKGEAGDLIEQFRASKEIQSKIDYKKLPF